MMVMLIKRCLWASKWSIIYAKILYMKSADIFDMERKLERGYSPKRVKSDILRDTVALRVKHRSEGLKGFFWVRQLRERVRVCLFFSSETTENELRDHGKLRTEICWGITESSRWERQALDWHKIRDTKELESQILISS